MGFELGLIPLGWAIITGLSFVGQQVTLRPVSRAEACALLDLPPPDRSAFPVSWLSRDESTFSVEPPPKRRDIMRRRLVLYIVFRGFFIIISRPSLSD